LIKLKKRFIYGKEKLDCPIAQVAENLQLKFDRWAAPVNTFLLIGALLGAVIGVLHAGYLYRDRIAGGHSGIVSAAWFAAWTLALWTVFGPYPLAFWIIGAVGLAFSRLRGKSGARQ
jgi:hypothetical protein